MKQFFRLFAVFLVAAGTLFLTGCGTPGSVNYSVGMGVYGGYGYPYYGYGGCCDGDIDINLPDRPDRPDRPNRPDRPSTLPVSRPSTGMGRPSSRQMSRPSRMPRGGGGRRR